MRRLRAWHWLVAALLAGLLAAPCIVLGLREDERQQFQRALGVSDRNAFRAPPIELSRLYFHLSPYRRVSLRGHYDHTREMLIEKRREDGEAGFHLVTPLQVEGGAFLVLRGWIPATRGAAAELVALHEAGPLVVEGFPLPELQDDGDEEGEPAALEAWPLRLERLSVKQLKQHLPYTLAPLVVQQLPGDDLSGELRRLSVPDFEDSSHGRNASWLYAAAAGLALLPFAGLWIMQKRRS